jgi:hypothetical protein
MEIPHCVREYNAIECIPERKCIPERSEGSRDRGSRARSLTAFGNTMRLSVFLSASVFLSVAKDLETVAA